MRFRLRITLVNGITPEQVQQFLAPYSSYVLVHHIFPDDKNPHVHAFVDDAMALSIDAFRKRVKRYFTIEKTSDYSIKHCEDARTDEYVQYLFNTKHGNIATLVSTHNFDSSRLLQLQAQAKDIADDFALRNESEQNTKKSTGPTQYELAMEVRGVLEAEHVVIADATIEVMTLATIKVLRKHRKGFCKFSLAKIIMTVMDDKRIVAQMQEYFHAI